MQLLIILALVASEVFGLQVNPLSDEFIDYINSKQSTWTAGRNFDENVPMQELRRLLGAKLRNPKLRPVNKVVHSDNSDIPESFDSREQWPECKNVIGAIADQSHCGSGWAVAAASVMTDRRCIHSNGKVTVPVSSLDLLSCLTKGTNNGCHGGSPIDAFDYWIQHGIVTGGLYNSSQGCKPYPFEHCDHYVPHSTNPCPGNSDTPECKQECDDASLTYANELTFGTGKSVWLSTVEEIQKEILANGPVVAGLTLYTDFFNYKSGIYQHVSKDISGAHAVRIVGWGVEDEVPYWLIANSWNDQWGDHGYFRILRGKDESDIEDNIFAALPKV